MASFGGPGCTHNYWGSLRHCLSLICVCGCGSPAYSAGVHVNKNVCGYTIPASGSGRNSGTNVQSFISTGCNLELTAPKTSMLAFFYLPSLITNRECDRLQPARNKQPSRALDSATNNTTRIIEVYFHKYRGDTDKQFLHQLVFNRRRVNRRNIYKTVETEYSDKKVGNG